MKDKVRLGKTKQFEGCLNTRNTPLSTCLTQTYEVAGIGVGRGCARCDKAPPRAFVSKTKLTHSEFYLIKCD